MAMNPKKRRLDKNGNPIVTKEELAESGMSLRDFLNKERGLTRRDEPAKKVSTPAPMDAATSARVQRNALEQRAMSGQSMASPKAAAPSRGELEVRARQGKDMSQAARNMEGYKPRRSGSPLAPKTTTPSKPVKRMPDWASRHAKKSN